MNVEKYIEFKAQALIKELAEKWDREKGQELLETLNDLFNADSTAKEEPPLPQLKLKPTQERKTLSRIAHVKRGEQKVIINRILDVFEEESKTGKRDFRFEGKTFGVSAQYLQRHIFHALNTNKIKRLRFPDLKIKYMAIPEGVICHIGRREE